MMGVDRTLGQLINKGANVDAKTRIEHTPLHLACRYGHYNIALALLVKGAQVDSRDNERNTPLHKAARCACCVVSWRPLPSPRRALQGNRLPTHRSVWTRGCRRFPWAVARLRPCSCRCFPCLLGACPLNCGGKGPRILDLACHVGLSWWCVMVGSWTDVSFGN